MRGPDSGLDEIVDFESVLAVPRHKLELLEVFQPVVQQPSRDPRIPLVVAVDHFAQQLVQAKAHFGADEHQRVPVELPQLLIQLLQQKIFGLIAEGLLHHFPLVDSDDHRPPLLQCGPYQIEVIQHHRGVCIHYVHHHVALFDMGHRADLYFS